MEYKTIAVVGAGVMGIDVALDLACYNFNVILKDITEEAILKAHEKITDSFRLTKLMKPVLKSVSIEAILSRITFTTEYKHFENVDLVIENVTEDWEVKKQLYSELKTKCRPTVVYAVNTSCVSITKISQLLPCPERVVGTHFMNPVPLKEIVEVIKGVHTSTEVTDQIINFLKAINKSAIVVQDFPGFVSNRLSHLFMNEAAFIVQDTIATPQQVDIIFKKGYGHKMGPLETADLIGLDTVVNSLDILYNSYQDSKFRCCPLLKRMVDAGFLGKKSGKGFYNYKNI